MNKKNIFMLIAIVLLVGYGSFTLGYKKGSAKGIQVGMAYNCQEDLNALKKATRKISDEVEKKLAAVEKKFDPYESEWLKIYNRSIPYYCHHDKIVLGEWTNDLSVVEKKEFIANYKKSLEYINKHGWQQDVIMHEVKKSCEERDNIAQKEKLRKERLESMLLQDQSKLTPEQRKEVELYRKEKAWNLAADSILGVQQK